MDWCSYFRCQDGATLNDLDKEICNVAPDYSRYAPPAASTTGGTNLGVVVYFRESKSSLPGWIGLLTQIIGNLNFAANSLTSFSAILLVEHQGHHYILTYGSGHAVAKRLPIERRFGKVALGNGKLDGEVRGITAMVHGTAGKVRVERRGRGGPTRELEVPRRANMAAHISAKVKIGASSHVASGGVGFRGIGPSSIQQLTTILDILEQWWNSGTENDIILAGLDRIVDVRQHAEFNALEDKRKDAFKRGDSTGFTLDLEDEVLWDATDVQYCVNRKWEKLPSGGLWDEQVLFKAISDAAATADPLRIHYKATLPNGAEPHTGRLADNLGLEIHGVGSGGSETAVYEQGAWYKASASWKQQVNRDVSLLEDQSKTLLAGLTLPKYTRKQSEDDYIGAVLAHQPLAGRCHKFHKVFPPGDSHLEFCDVCVDGRYLFAMKRGSGRNACDDAVRQAVNSATAMLDTKSWFIDWINSELDPNWVIRKEDRSNVVYCVTLLLDREKPTSAFSIRSKDALSMLLHEVERFGFRAAVLVLGA